MGIFTYIKIGIIAALVIVCSYLVWNYKHMESVIAKQQDKIGGLELGQKDLKDKQKKYDDFMDATTKAKGRVANVRKQVTQDVTTVPDSGMDALYDQFRLHPGSEVRPATPGGKRRLKNTTPGSP